MLEHLGKDIRKIIRVGNCLAITLPRDYLKVHNLKLGDRVELFYNRIILFEPLDYEEIRRKLGKDGLEEDIEPAFRERQWSRKVGGGKNDK